MENRGVSRTAIVSGTLVAALVALLFVGGTWTSRVTANDEGGDDAAAWTFLPEVLATFGDDKITREDFIGEIGGQAPPEMPQENLMMMVKGMLEQMINQKVLVRLADEAGFKPSKEMAEKEFDKALGEISEEEKARLTQQLTMQGMDLGQYREMVTNDPRAMRGMMISAWLEQTVGKQAEPSEADIKKFYDEHPEDFKAEETVTASHILIRAGEDEAAAKAEVESILQRAKAGEDFGKLAEEESACPSGKQNKGSLGAFPRGVMDKAFEDAAFALQPGQMSEVVKTQFGFHIIKSEGRQEAATTPLAEVSKDISGFLRGQNMNEAVEKIVEAEKAKLDVKINL